MIDCRMRVRPDAVMSTQNEPTHSSAIHDAERQAPAIA